ncbi:MAG TPA: hypothetical protein VK742_18730, partial [Candidatus Sulfotelmatobacter sp.]|nr:hypothetical protein [Candidatus Sulfotelmatobacter sp.]
TQVAGYSPAAWFLAQKRAFAKSSVLQKVPENGPFLTCVDTNALGEREKRSQRLDTGTRQVIQGFKARSCRGIPTLTLSRREGRGEGERGKIIFIA